MEIGASFVAGAESFELVQPGEGALDHPPHLAQTGAVGDAASGDHGFDAVFPQQAAVLVEVVAPVRLQPPRLAAGTSAKSPDRRDGIQQRQALGDVVRVATGERDGKRGPVAVDDQVVLGAGTGTVDGPGTDVVPPLSARTCEPSTMHSSRSNESARRSSAGRAACRRGHTPASVQPRNRRQAVTPEPTVSAGTSRQATPVRRTYKMPARAARSGTRSRPECRRRRSGASDSSGATRSHRSSGTRSAHTWNSLPTKIDKCKTRSSTHSETISWAERVVRPAVVMLFPWAGSCHPHDRVRTRSASVLRRPRVSSPASSSAGSKDFWSSSTPRRQPDQRGKGPGGAQPHIKRLEEYDREMNRRYGEGWHFTVATMSVVGRPLASRTRPG